MKRMISMSIYESKNFINEICKWDTKLLKLQKVTKEWMRGRLVWVQMRENFTNEICKWNKKLQSWKQSYGNEKWKVEDVKPEVLGRF